MDPPRTVAAALHSPLTALTAHLIQPDHTTAPAVQVVQALTSVRMRNFKDKYMGIDRAYSVGGKRSVCFQILTSKVGPGRDTSGYVDTENTPGRVVYSLLHKPCPFQTESDAVIKHLKEG